MTDTGFAEIAELVEAPPIPREFGEVGTRPLPDGILRVFDKDENEIRDFDIATAATTPYSLMRTELLRPGQVGYDSDQPKHRKLAEWDDPTDNPGSTIGRIDYFYDHDGNITAEREVEVPKKSLPYLTRPELSEVKSVKVHKYSISPDGKKMQHTTMYSRDESNPAIIKTGDLGSKPYGLNDVYFVDTD